MGLVRVALPIDEMLPELTASLREGPSAVLRAPTGSGKTTRVPPALLSAGLAGRGRIIVLEPRRLAARAAARRIAQENGWQLGREVGYQVRFDRKASRNTRILVVTEGVLLRFLQADPFLERAEAVVFDEFHERNLNSDLALALVRQLQRQVRRELRIVVMSATLDPEPICRFLGDCPRLESEGRLFPLETRYLPASGDLTDTRRLAGRVTRAVRLALEGDGGDLLVFLPGVGEIRQAQRSLQPLATEHGLLLAPLFGDLSAGEQDRALRPQQRRRVVLATNVAETSVTVAGVRTVVDSGLVKLLRFDPGRGLNRLELTRVSRDSARQRAGRAGREGPGRVYRLWSEHEHRGLQARTPPEVTRVDLSGAFLQLLEGGEPDPAAFPWFERPEEAFLERARELLARLGATQRGSITSLGRRMARLPLHPRLSRLLLEGARLAAPRRTALLCAWLHERDPLRGDDPDPPSRRCDLEPALDRLENPRAAPDLDRAAARHLQRVREHLLRGLGRVTGAPPGGGPEEHEAVQQALLAAFPDRLVRRRGPGDRRGVMVGGRGVQLAGSSGVRQAELLVAVEVSDAAPGLRSEALVRRASSFEREWIPAKRLETSVDVEFDPVRERVLALRRTRFADLVIEEKAVRAPADRAAEVLAAAAGDRLDRALDLTRPETASFLARLRWLAGEMPELELPPFDDTQLRELLPALAAGKRSFAQLRRLPLLDHLRGLLSFRQQRALEREAPERIQAPSGSRIRLLYEQGRPPVLAVRIQEMFGLAETPRLAGGRVPVLLHLLAPNQRPQQVTQDLAGFWKNTYPEVRGELRGRYPKHAWPEDPLLAKPRRAPGRH